MLELLQSFTKFSQVNRDTVLSYVSDRTSNRSYIPEQEFYLRETVDVARSLLGCLLIRVIQSSNADEIKVCGGRIVEVEAYLGETDPACHTARGITRRTEIFYRAGGIAYVYRIYGIHHCLNVITLPSGKAGCVLVRAVEPIFGIEEMAASRGISPERLYDLCSGPGKLCQAMGIDAGYNGCDLRAGNLLILALQNNERSIAKGPRIGISKATYWPLRFWIEGSSWVSGGVLFKSQLLP